VTLAILHFVTLIAGLALAVRAARTVLAVAGSLLSAVENGPGSSVGEMVGQRKQETVRGGNDQLGRARGEGHENARGEGNK